MGVINPEIEITGDGTHTLRHPVLGDSYHSVNGAETESLHVFIRNGFDLCGEDRVRVLEAGFGSGLNALLTMEAARRQGKEVEYTAVELYPVSLDTASRLTYASREGFRTLHQSAWGESYQISPFFSLKKLESDLADTSFDTTFDLVYFDAFSPDTQPELWSAEVMARIFESMAHGAALVTYSAKGDVKRALRSVGFEVKRLPGAPGKRHMLRAVKP